MSYTTQENIQSRLGTTLTADQVAYYSDVLEPALDKLINKLTGISFASDKADILYISGSGTTTLVTPTIHSVTAVSKIKSDGTEEVIDPTSYITYPRGATQVYALIRTSGIWVCGLQNYKISCTPGYAEVPDDISMVATELAVNIFNENLNNLRNEKVGDWMVTYEIIPKTLSVSSQQILDSYRRLSLGL